VGEEVFTTSCLFWADLFFGGGVFDAVNRSSSVKSSNFLLSLYFLVHVSSSFPISDSPGKLWN